MNDARNWVRNLRSALERAGYRMLKPFLVANPDVGWAGLPSRLSAKVPPLCITLYALDEAVTHDDLGFFARDDFARILLDTAPDGRPISRPALLRAAAERTPLPNATAQATAGRMAALLLCTALPGGWRPRGASDPILLEAWSRADTSVRAATKPPTPP